MGRSGYSSADRTQISAKVPEQLKEEFKETCDALGESMTDVIVEQMVRVVSEHGGETVDDAYPDDDLLRAAYQQLRRHAPPDTSALDADAARSLVAEEVGLKKDHIKRLVFRPLERQGYIRPKWGMIVVVPPDAVPGD
jgi:antitoxin component of RelBE/YafQ-DinJ toxin-antitoxin module